METSLKKVTITGFKSIKSLVDFELGELNVLIGANGAGKSNFVDFFRMLRAIRDKSLQRFSLERGGASGFFHMGSKRTPKISAQVVSEDCTYNFNITANTANQMMLDEDMDCGDKGPRIHGASQLESSIRTPRDEELRQSPSTSGDGQRVYAAVPNLRVYQFHDTSLLAMMRREQSVRDRDFLRPDASNIAPYLLRLREKHEGSYSLIRDTVRLAAPFFDDFRLEPEIKGPEELVQLEWQQEEGGFTFQPHHLSDGTIRFICLATALLQPVLPTTIVIDEPELGLHPVAIGLLAGLIRSASARTQVIISTQSPTLLNKFDPKDVIVVNRQAGCSTFNRLDLEMLREWLEEYSVGELWQKNVLEGGPACE